MKRLNQIGKLIVGLGVLSIFWKDQGHWGCFGGYFDNTWNIITVSGIIIVIGISMILVSKRYIDK